MKEIAIEAETREISTKHNLKALRNSGKIPAVFYGEGEKPVTLLVDAKSFEKLLSTGISNSLISLKFGDINKTAIIKEVQNHIISQHPIHIDFQGVSLTKKIEVSVHLKIQGEAPGVKVGGGVLEHILRDVKVRCLPANIPHHIIVDVSKLEIGHAFVVKDLPVIEGIEYVTEANSPIVNIVSPTELEEVAPAAVAGAATAEPEVIAKGKKPEEGAAAPAADGKKAPEAKAGEAKK